MRSVRSIRLAELLFIASILLGIAPSASAQPLADRVPADAIVYVGWRGAENVPGYNESHLKAILDQSNIPAVFSQMVPQLIALASRQDPNAGAALSTFAELGSPLWKHPTAIYFAGVNFDGPQPMPRAAIICKAGPDAQALLDKINTIQASVGPDAPPIRAVKSDDIVALTIGYGDNEPAFAGAGAAGAAKAPDPIGPSRNFANALTQVQSDPALIVYTDVEKLLALVDDAVQRAPDPQAKEKWPKVRDALGIGGLRRIVHTSGFDGKEWMSSTFIEAPTPRRGLLTMIDSQPMPEDLLRAVPADATIVIGGSFDPAKLINAARQAVGEIDPQAQQKLNQVIGIASMYVGRNIVDDVLAPLGEHWVAYTSPTIGGAGLAGLVAINKPDDAKKAEQGLTSTLNAIVNTISGQIPKQTPLRLTNHQAKVGDLTINYVAVPLVSPAWAATPDGKLYLAPYPQTIAAAARFTASQGGGAKSILDNPDFVAIRKRLGGEKASGIGFIDLRRGAGEGYQQALALSRLALGMADLFGAQSPELVLPPLDVILPHVAPAGSVSWTDDAGWHARSLSPFPGAQLLASQQGGAVASTALMTSILLPSLNRARETANRVKCASNMRQMGQAMLLYANEHKGKYPEDMTELAKYLLDASPGAVEVFVCPSGNVSVPPTLRKMTADDQAKWVGAHSPYVYIGRGKTTAAGAEEVVIYESMKDHSNDGMNVLYADGHVEFQHRPAAEKLIRDATGAAPK